MRDDAVLRCALPLGRGLGRGGLKPEQGAEPLALTTDPTSLCTVVSVASTMLVLTKLNTVYITIFQYITHQHFSLATNVKPHDQSTASNNLITIDNT